MRTITKVPLCYRSALHCYKSALYRYKSALYVTKVPFMLQKCPIDSYKSALSIVTKVP